MPAITPPMAAIMPQLSTKKPKALPTASPASSSFSLSKGAYSSANGFTLSITGCSASLAKFVNAVSTGAIASPSSESVFCSFSCASRCAIVALAFSSYVLAASSYKPKSVSRISFSRSASSLHAARLSLNASSLTPAQLSASANTPVTVPHFAVSLALSVKPSIGKLSL